MRRIRRTPGAGSLGKGIPLTPHIEAGGVRAQGVINVDPLTIALSRSGQLRKLRVRQPLAVEIVLHIRLVIIPLPEIAVAEAFRPF